MSRNILLKIAADVDPARRGLRGVKGDLKALAETKTEPLVRLREQGLEQKLTRLQERLAALSRQESTPRVKIAMGQVAGQIQRVERELAQMGVAGERAGRHASAGLVRAGHASDGLAHKLKEHRSEFIGFAKGAVGIAAAFSAITDAKSAVETTDNLAKATLILGRNFGFTAEEASKWAVVAQSRDVDPTALSTGFTRLSRAVEQARGGAKSYQETFKQLGVSNADLARGQRDFPFLISKVTEAFSHMSGGTRRASIAQQIFGRGSRGLLLLLRQGSQGFEAQSKMAEKYGATLNEKTLGGVEKLVVAQRQAHYATTGLQIAFGTGLAPILTRVTQRVSHFILQMRNGTGAGGRFARGLRTIWNDAKPVIGVLGSIVRGLSHIPHAMTIAIAAWALFRIRAVRALAVTRLRLVGMFLGLGTKAAEGGAVAGSRFGGGFARTAAKGILSFGWAGIGAAIGGIMVSEIADKIAGHFNLTNSIGTPQSLVPAELQKLFHGLFGGGGDDANNADKTGQYPKYTSGKASVQGADLPPIGSGVFRGFNRTGIKAPGGRDPRGVFAGGHLSPQERRNQRRERQERANRQSLQDILAGIGSPGEVTAANLGLDLRTAERDYAKAVRRHGVHSAAATQAAQDVIQARQAIADAKKSESKSGTTTTGRHHSKTGTTSPDATPAERSQLAAARRYAAIVRRYGADSSQAKAAKDREGIAGVRAAIQTARDRLASDVRKFGSSSEKAVRDRIALSKLQVRLIQANNTLADALKKNTAAQHKALLPRLTDVAYHPVTGHMHHNPIVHGIGAAGHTDVHQTIHNNITTPGGIQYPDAEAWAAAMQRKLAAKGNG